MDSKSHLELCARRTATWPVVAATFLAVLICVAAQAFAQDTPPPAPKPQSEGFFSSVSRWFSQQSSNVSNSLKDAGQKVQNIGDEAGAAAKTTVESAKDAAGAVARIPVARPVSGHEKCQVASNGAPDCIAAANTMCKAKGFDSGKSLDMTTAEVCPAKVWMAGRTTGPECRTETFVSRALCQ